jgi:hypothetical protein
MDNEKKTIKVDPEDIKLASEAAPDDLKEHEPVNVFNEVLDWVESFIFAMFVIILIFRAGLSPPVSGPWICCVFMNGGLGWFPWAVIVGFLCSLHICFLSRPLP